MLRILLATYELPHVRFAVDDVSDNRRETSRRRQRTSVIVAATLLLQMRAEPIVSAPLPPTDDDLIAAAIAGGGYAFGVLVERYERAVYHMAYRTLHDPEEAKDATQEAFFRAYRALRTFRPGAKFSTWILTIVYHACCDRLARRKRYSSEYLPDRADTAAGPEAQAEAADDARRLRAAIDALPQKYRSVITLFHLQNKQYEEIALVLDLPMGTVKTHLFRAKELLRKALEAEPRSVQMTPPPQAERHRS